MSLLSEVCAAILCSLCSKTSVCHQYYLVYNLIHGNKYGSLDAELIGSHTHKGHLRFSNDSVRAIYRFPANWDQRQSTSGQHALAG